MWGVIALPLRSMLYVRQVDVPKLTEKYDWEFRTKHELGRKLLTWFIGALQTLGVKTKVWLVVDGAYATRPFVTDGLVGTGAVHYVFYRGSVVPGDKATLVWNRHATYVTASFPTVYYPLNDLDLLGYNEANNNRLGTSTRTVDNVEQVVAAANVASYIYKVHAPGSFVGVTQEDYGLAFSKSAVHSGLSGLSSRMSQNTRYSPSPNASAW